ncbi:enoyl-CoA hydratase/isomerase family protein [Burkholderia pyrrocinia]|uniref:enoyl-CoA hydratase/isomerase family protein n=1 Tax=Burkholderia pyrrocinia TaxID=60550 RepID=UPI001BCB8AF4|nr:enoyl-CoA hydratase/isomerase family protein [Burkholderia pyrrocinia]QVN23133.1 enoyl-CoA hydratase/isomerase family protein [Burkholderia pyrrocinia]
MNEEPTLRVDVADGIATLILNRAQQKNALNAPMRAALRDAVHAIRADRSVRAVVLRGAGDDFCSGGDLRAMNVADAQAGRDRIDDLHGWIGMLLDLDRPVVAAVDGVAYGAGFSLALLADFVVASPRARFCMPFMKVGLVPDCGAFYTLPRVVGMPRAKDLVFSAREIGAEEARQLGAVFEIVPHDALHARARQLAASLAGASPVAFGLAKRALNQSHASDLRAMLEMEALAQGIAFTTDYHREAVRRFTAKQPPLFNWPAQPDA